MRRNPGRSLEQAQQDVHHHRQSDAEEDAGGDGDEHSDALLVKGQVAGQLAQEGKPGGEQDNDSCNKYHDPQEYECLADVLRWHRRYCSSEEAGVGVMVSGPACRCRVRAGVDVRIEAGYLILKPI